ncbi:MAG: hypothetical protein WC694_01320 [Candidatus Paceibacterota bacterium]|jgi:hypothetical protein
MKKNDYFGLGPIAQKAMDRLPKAELHRTSKGVRIAFLSPVTGTMSPGVFCQSKERAGENALSRWERAKKRKEESYIF